MTDAEMLLWRRLRKRQLKGERFRRQHRIGSFIVDFVCLEKRLVVELDGGQHADHVQYDERRDACIMMDGFRVMRFWNNEVMKDIESVLVSIADALG